MVVTLKFLFFLIWTAVVADKCNQENITIFEQYEIHLQPHDFDNDLCVLRFVSDDGEAITLDVDDISCRNQYHVNINGAVRPIETQNNCKTTINSKSNSLEVILTSRKTSLNLSQEGLRLSVSKQKFGSSEELVADISDTPIFSYNRGKSRDTNDTKKDDGYIDWAVYVVVLVLIVLPIVAVLYCACKSTMPTSTSQTNNNASTNARRTNETRLNQTAKTISQQPMNP